MNPEFDVLATYEPVVYAIVDASMYAFRLTATVAIGVLLVVTASW